MQSRKEDRQKNSLCYCY